MNLFCKRSLTVFLILALLLVGGCGVNNINSHDSTYQSGLSSFGVSSYPPTPLPSDGVGASSDPFFTDSMFDSLISGGISSNAPPLSSGDLGASSSLTSTSPSHQNGNTTQTVTSAPTAPPQNNPKKFDMVGIWISCFEMPFVGADAATARTAVYDMMKRVKDQGYNAVFCHVRPFGDAFYPSDYFPFSKYVSGTEGVDPGYDPLKLMITAAKSFGLQFHAWINPYRVSSLSTDPAALSKDNIAAKWLTDGSGRAVAAAGGMYFNPAENDVKRLILNGIKEILNNYSVDGIHFDDYFYPTTDPKFDQIQYDQYLSTTKNPLALDDWRRANVSALVASVYTLCKQRGVTFGISPAGDISLSGIDENYSKLYADIPLWMATPGYVDYIIPQIYFGYNHPKAGSRYSRLLGIWCSLPRHKDLELYIGLGAYKMNEACDDSAEWHFDNTLMARQVKDAFNGGMSGAVVFSYSASTTNKEHNQNQIKNMFTIINYLENI